MKALSLARNILEVIEYGNRKQLNSGAATAGTINFPDALALNEANLALGTALFEWVVAKKSFGGFACELQWTPAPDAAGSSVDSVSKAVCTVKWQEPGGKRGQISLTRILAR